MLLPTAWIFPHEFRDDREYGESWQWQMPAFECESGSNIDVVSLGLCWGETFDVDFGQIWERDICGIESERARGIDRDRDFEGAAKIWLQSILESAW